jgi:hypothetical protein
MRIKSFLLILSIVVTMHDCALTQSTTISIKSEHPMTPNGVFPEVISTGIPIVAVLPTGSDYKTIAISTSGNIYSINSLLKEPYITQIKKINFKEPCKEYISNPGLPIIYGTGIRDYQIIDLNNHTIESGIVSFNGNEEFFWSYLFKTNKPILLMTLEHTGWNDSDSYEETYLYDFNQKKVEKIVDGYFASMWIQLDEKTFLREEMQRGNKPSVWQIFYDNLNNKINNKLTDTLNKLYPHVFKNSYNYQKKLLIFKTADSNQTKYTISWDSLYKDISVVPWTFQKPKEIILGKDFLFSQDGNWLRNTACKESDLETDYNVFYHISDAYPASVSIPIFGIESVVGIQGAFLDTPEWGTVYVDLSRGLDGILMVYKMRDVMAKIVERAKEMR